MPQRAVILAAGVGRRMDKLGKQKAKCLIPIAGKPILFHQIDNLLRLSIEDITIVIGYKTEQIKNEIRNRKKYSFVKYLFNPFYFFTDSIVSLWVYLNHTPLDNSIIILSGDRVLRPDIYDDVANLDESALVVLGPHSYSEPPKDSIALSRNRETIVAIGARSSYVSGGVAYISKKDLSLFFAAIEEILREKEGFNKWWLEGIAGLIRKGKRIKPIIFPLSDCININKPRNLDNTLIRNILGG